MWKLEYNGVDGGRTNDHQGESSLTIFKDRRPYPHRLSNAIEAYHLEDRVQNSHRAIYDCLALFEVVKAMQEERDDLESYINVFGYNTRYGLEGRRMDKVSYHPQAFRNGMASPDEILPKTIG